MNTVEKHYIKRPAYLKKALAFSGTNLIKVLTGQRRTGKSYLMLQVIDEIRKMHPQARLIFIDKELMEFDFIKSARDLIDFVKERTEPGSKTFLFIDEVHEINEFEKALRSILNEGLAEIWCTGSNAEILSGELADKLSGRYVEIRIHSLSFAEFLEFHKLIPEKANLYKYMKFGGMPNLVNFPMEDNVVFDYLKTINATILLKDIIKRNEIRNVIMLENLIRFLAGNTGSLFSAGSISRFLKSQGQSISPSIISNYIAYILNAFYLIKVMRSDLQGKKIFEINEKYYFEDIGLLNAWTGYQPMHINKLIENLVFRHMLQSGFHITVGSIGDREVDFVTENAGNKIYIQCAYLLADEKTRKREFDNLLKINDNHRKIVISLDEPSGGNIEGIEHMHLMDFLLSEF